MLYREIIAICSEIHTKHINTLCGQNVEFVDVKPSGTYSNHWALEGYAASKSDVSLGQCEAKNAKSSHAHEN
jgi:hypothetical protein